MIVRKTFGYTSRKRAADAVRDLLELEEKTGVLTRDKAVFVESSGRCLVLFSLDASVKENYWRAQGIMAGGEEVEPGLLIEDLIGSPSDYPEIYIGEGVKTFRSWSYKKARR